VLLYNDARSGGDPVHPWIQIRYDEKASQLVFNYFVKAMTPETVQSRWDMVTHRCRWPCCEQLTAPFLTRR
jgi:hypothetical protein